MIELANIQQQEQFKILLIGDNCIDVYQYGTVDRISPEAPVPVFVPTHKEEREGMAGNVYANLAALGCSVDIICGHASKKTRLMDSRSKQQILRIDEDVESTPIVNVDPSGYDAVVISDYNKGLVSYELIESIIQKTGPGKVFVDTKKIDLERFQGAWIKINELEYSKIKSECTGLIVTRGDSGAEAVHHGIVCSAPSVEVVDVTGAGDTFLAAFAYCFLQSNDIRQSIQFANLAAAVTVQHVGCYAPKLEEIL